MKNKFNIVVMTLAFISAMVLGSCSEHDDIRIVDDGEVQFTSNITEAIEVDNNPGTRMTDNVWAANDKIGIYMHSVGDNSGTALASNIEYVTTAGKTGILTPVSTKLFYPEDDRGVEFSAYYPYRVKATGTNGVWNSANDQYQINIVNQDIPALIDLLWARNTSVSGHKRSTAGVIPLTFAHQLTKFILLITVDPQVGPTTDMTVKIEGMNTQGMLNVKTGPPLIDINSVASFTPRTVTNALVYDAIILPHTVETAAPETVVFTIGQRNFVWTIPAETVFKPGEQHEWKISITTNHVTATGTITPWTVGTGGSGEAIW